MKKTVQDLILERFDRLEEKMDKISTETIPNLMTSVAVVNQRTKDEAKNTTKLYSTVWGGITLLVSLTGLAIAYFKH